MKSTLSSSGSRSGKNSSKLGASPERAANSNPVGVTWLGNTDALAEIYQHPIAFIHHDEMIAVYISLADDLEVFRFRKRSGG